MKKQFLNLGKTLNKAEQRGINWGSVLLRAYDDLGGGAACDQSISCTSDDECSVSCKCREYLPEDKRCS